MKEIKSKILRKSWLISSVILGLLLLFASTVNGSTTFKDLGSVPWAQDEIYYLNDKGIIGGYGNGLFGPSDKITREQVATMLVRDIYPNQVATVKPNFKDVNENDYFYNAIALATEKGLMGGYPDGTFHGEKYISRAETAVVIDNAYNIQRSNFVRSFSDVESGRWSTGSILDLASQGIINGYPDDTFQPSNDVTRAEFSVILTNGINHKNQDIIPDSEPEQNKNITSINPIERVTVIQGREVVLPEIVEVRYEDTTTGEVPINWDKTELDIDIPGIYTLTGNIEGTQLTTTVEVSVESINIEIESANVTVNDDNSLEITGTVKNAASVVIQLKNGIKKNAFLNDNGDYTLTTGILEEGTHEIYITAYDNFSIPSKTVEKSITIESKSLNNDILTNIHELETYLEENFSTLNTVIGKTDFTFDILQNERSYTAYDYWIQVEYEYDFFGGAMNSIKYTSEQKQILYNELKLHQKNLAEAVIAAMPSKKFYGGYYDSWYRYPTLRVDLITRRYFSWTNYEEPSYIIHDRYNATHPSTFRWDNSIDDRLY